MGFFTDTFGDFFGLPGEIVYPALGILSLSGVTGSGLLGKDVAKILGMFAIGAGAMVFVEKQTTTSAYTYNPTYPS